MRTRTGGVEGNERLTAATAVVLLVLLAIEGVTILALRPLLSLHVFVGMLLVPLVGLKLASTGYRLLRYYQRKRAYVAKGPPHPLMRFVVAPALVTSTVGIFASGIAMIAFDRGGIVLGLHKASFIVWLGAMGTHVLVYGRRLLALARSEWRARGAAVRVGAVVAFVAAGLALAALTVPLARPWAHRLDDGRGAGAATR